MSMLFSLGTFWQRRANGRNMLWRWSCLTLCIILQFRPKDQAASQITPSRGDFAVCRLTDKEKKTFLDKHNEYRGMVSPQAADMEYLVWNDDIANLAQMWSDKCIWDHGFYKFGDQYPHPVNFTGQLGQNLAREHGKLEDPSDRLERWFNERDYYTYSQYSSSGGACSKTPCGHYTQMVWAKAKYVGCGVNWCENFFANSYQRYGTMVSCDYDTGNIVGSYPYQKGKPCTKCASGKGFCYKNMCRDCIDYDKHCGTEFPQAKCTTHPDLMEKLCPKMCQMCKCPLECQNGGTLNRQTCTCSCSTGWTGTDCTERCVDDVGKQSCLNLIKYNPGGCRGSAAAYLKQNCEATCGYCDDGSGTYTTTLSPVVTATIQPIPQPLPTPPPATASRIDLTVSTSNPATTLPVPTKPAPQAVCKADSHSSCEMWAAIGECEKNPAWMIPNCCVSCKYHQAPKECTDSDTNCPRWAHFGQCEVNRVWMLDNCRKSCNQCGDCKDTDPKCPSWALLKQCRLGDRVTWMNTKCRRSCGLCTAYDRHAECPAWTVMGECKKSNSSWMIDHCPKSCDVPLSEALFCGGKSDGNYQAPSTCQAYIACSHGVTSHVDCPEGEKFDTLKRICEPADRATCTFADLIKGSDSSFKIVATLKRG